MLYHDTGQATAEKTYRGLLHDSKNIDFVDHPLLVQVPYIPPGNT